VSDSSLGTQDSIKQCSSPMGKFEDYELLHLSHPLNWNTI